MKKSITLIAVLICFATIVRAENENKNNEGVLLAPKSATGLSAPVAKAATYPKSTSFVANWNDVQGATSFLLRVVDNQTQEFVIKDVELQAYTYNVTGLKPNSSYSFSVKAKNANEVSSISNWIDVKTLRSGPVTKAASNISATSFTANWEDVEGATSFLLRVTDDQTQDFIVKDLALQAFSYEVVGLKPNSTYFYSVVAKFPNNEVTDLSNWIEVKTKSQTGIADNDVNLNIYPNPATNFITIRGVEKGSEIKLISPTGSLVKRSIAQSCNVELMLQDVQKGIYFVVVDGNNNRKIQKITIE